MRETFARLTILNVVMFSFFKTSSLPLLNSKKMTFVESTKWRSRYWVVDFFSWHELESWRYGAVGDTPSLPRSLSLFLLIFMKKLSAMSSISTTTESNQNSCEKAKWKVHAIARVHLRWVKLRVAPRPDKPSSREGWLSYHRVTKGNVSYALRAQDDREQIA